MTASFAGLSVAVLAVVGTLPVVRRLIVADLAWCYPYLTPDSHDWINNGLFWAGHPLRPSLRPPGLPLLVAALSRLGLLELLPVASFLALGLATALLFRLLRLRHDAGIAALAAWIYYANDFVQDLTRYVMVEVYVVVFLVGAALAFAHAAERPRAYAWCGGLLGVGTLFHYACVPAGVGFALAVLLARRDHLRLRALWLGAALGALPAVLWQVSRVLYYQRHPGIPRHVIEELVRVSLVNVRFYLVVGVALLGLALLPLYGAGLLRVAAAFGGGAPPPAPPGDRGVGSSLSAARPDAFRLAFLAPLLSLLGLFVVLYGWVDKRFLLYAFPFAVCLLAEGLEALRDYARRGPLPAVLAGTYLVGAVLWNQIRYPSYRIELLAITPRDFIDLAFHLEGARVTRLHPTMASALRGSLFDYGQAPVTPCDLDAPAHRSLLEIRARLPRLLEHGEPLGFVPTTEVDPVDYWVKVNRLSNVLRVPVVRADLASVAITERTEGEGETLLSVPPYRVVRLR